MFLQSCQITNFRGLRHLKVSFESGSTVLIGENAWGKSSLLSALYMMLGQGRICTFAKDDLYIPIELQFSSADEQRERTARALMRSQRGSTRPPLNLSGGKQVSGAKTEPQSKPDTDVDEAEELPLTEPLQKLFLDDYDFVKQDVYVNEAPYLAIDLIFCEPNYGVVEHSRRLRALNPAWQLGSDGLYRIHWQAIGYAKGDNFITEHYLLDGRGKILACATERILNLIIAMNPVLRLRDSRTLPCTQQMAQLPGAEHDKDEILSFTQLLADFALSEDVNAKQIAAGLETLNSLSEKYLSLYGHQRHILRKGRLPTRGLKEILARPLSLESLASLKSSLKSSTINKEKILAVLFASALFLSKGERNIDPQARPILILEDIEGRFHPSLLLSFWSVVENVPVQKIVTTNSGDLISAIPLFSLRRLCKQYYDTRCYAVDEKCLNADDLRRIAFHIRINRPMTLFARCWILVEGETEIWLINEMAAILGISLACEGVRMVEFAQCGLHPLMRLASSLGISFYVLTDGDEAGQRYGQSVLGFVGKKRLHKHLTILPHLDIEHFLYSNGFADVYQQAAGLNAQQCRSLHSDKIIEQAIHKKSKPGLALAVLNAMQQRGVQSVPPLFRQMLGQILLLAKNEMSLD